MAASVSGLASLASGTQLAMPGGSRSDELVPLIRAVRPTVMFILPAILRMLLCDPRLNKTDFFRSESAFMVEISCPPNSKTGL